MHEDHGSRTKLNESSRDSAGNLVPPVTLNSVRQTRIRIESDVLKMHNRVNLLFQEEDRFLRMIDATR